MIIHTYIYLYIYIFMSVCVMMIISIMNGGQSAPINQPFKLIIEFLKHTFIKAFCAFNISASTTLCMSELIISHYAFAAVVITFVYRKHTKKLGNYCSMKVLSSRLPGVWSASRRRSSNPICLIVKKKQKTSVIVKKKNQPYNWYKEIEITMC